VIQIAGYAPDADPNTPGIITACTGLIPSLRGMEGAPSGVAPSSVGALASSARGAAVVTSTTGSRRIFAGTQTKLYELVSAVWTDVSRGGSYTGSVDSRWSFAGFGNAAVAANGVEVIQASTGAAFADVATAPVAHIVVTAPNFVLAFNTVDGTYGTRTDGWWCSAFQDHTSWTPSLTTQATNGRLVADGGAITAAARLGQEVIAYKSHSIYRGTYVGAPVVWQWDAVPGEVGCVGPEAVCDVGGAHVFVGEDNVWFFDGTRPVGICEGQVRQTLFNDISPDFTYRTICSFDRRNNLVRIYYPSTSSTTGNPDRCLVYHMGRRVWGRADSSVECVLNYTNQSVTFDSAPGTFDGAPLVSFDSQYWLSGGRLPGEFTTAHQLVVLAGDSTGSTMTTGNIGDDDEASMLRRVRLRYATAPTSATLAGFTRSGAAVIGVYTKTVSQTDSGFDLRQSGRWHYGTFTFAGPVEIVGMVADVVKAGKR
jgi:hypothetical protein